MRFGADEAGKGPVLGSMFAAAVRAPAVAIPADVDDSKRLQPEHRRELAAALRDDDRVDIGVAEVPPARIDSRGRWADADTDMNTLTVAAQAEALAAVVHDGDGGVCDGGETDADRFGCRVADRLDADVELRAEHGADETYAMVAAASVVAKVERDAHVAALADRYADRGYADLGSGYPSDQSTREFLKRYVDREGDLPDCARHSWSTCEDVLAAREQSALHEF